MSKHRHHRFGIHTVSFLLTLAIIFAASTLFYAIRASDYERTLRYASEQSLGILLESASNLDSALVKLSYSASPGMTALLAAQIWREAEVAKAALAQLPQGDGPLEKTQKFIAQTGDYAFSLLRTSSRGDTLAADQREAISSLSTACRTVTGELTEMQARLDEGVLTLGTPSKESTPVNHAFTGIEQEFPKYASLIYDGPFSEHLDKQEPAALKGLPEISLDQARRKAAEFLSISPDALGDGGTTGSKIPCYRFTFNDGGTIDVTKAGGAVLSLRDARAVEAASLTADDAVVRAKEYLKARGYPEMQESYYTLYEDTITINLAAKVNDVLLYPDLIKVVVALDNGDVVGLESRGYLMSHRSRSLPAPAVTAQTAQRAVAPGLNVLENRLALIPTDGGNEILCHEMICETAEKTHVIIYVNAQTGLEENILILLESENGTLTM